MGTALSSKSAITSWAAADQMHILAVGNLDKRMTLEDLFTEVPLSPVIKHSDGIDIDSTAGDDSDVDLLTCLVTGTPKLWWDESGDTFALTKGLAVVGNLAVSGNTPFAQFAAPTAPTATVNPAAGNLTGTYWYSVSFVTAIGETEPSPLAISVAPSSEQVDLTNIPVGPAGVTARKIYRSKRTTPFTGLGQQLVTTINDNVTTTYTDNIADASVTTYARYMNTTGGVVYNGSTVIMAADLVVTILGHGAGALNAGIRNTFIGKDAGAACTYGYQNTLFGDEAGKSITTGYENSLFGTDAGELLTTGYYNVFLGVSAGMKAVNAVSNICIGYASGGELVNAAYCEMIGYNSGGNLTGPSGVVCIGSKAALYLNNGSTKLTGSTLSVYIGYECLAHTDSETNAIVIGANAIGMGSNTTVIGNSSTVYTRLHGKLLVGTHYSSYQAEIANTAGCAIAVSTDQASGSTGSPKYLDVNFLGYAKAVKARIRARECSDSTGTSTLLFSATTHGGVLTDAVTISSAGIILADAKDIEVNTTTGTKIGTATSQKLGFWNATPVVQQTTGVAEAAFVQGSGDGVNDNSTFGGYTLQQVVKALQLTGLIA